MSCKSCALLMQGPTSTGGWKGLCHCFQPLLSPHHPCTQRLRFLLTGEILNHGLENERYKVPIAPCHVPQGHEWLWGAQVRSSCTSVPEQHGAGRAEIPVKPLAFSCRSVSSLAGGHSPCPGAVVQVVSPILGSCSGGWGAEELPAKSDHKPAGLCKALHSMSWHCFFILR